MLACHMGVQLLQLWTAVESLVNKLLQLLQRYWEVQATFLQAGPGWGILVWTVPLADVMLC